MSIPTIERRLFSNVSRLGFGCASLGSRVGAKKGLAALETAFDEGINWFDLAPSYGDGEAESIFSRFSRSKRSQLYICTKVGIAPGKISPIARILKPAARFAVEVVPPIRRVVAHGRRPSEPIPINSKLILQSVDASLRHLGTDYIDVIALHDPKLAELARDDVADALMRVVASGKARAAGIAGTIDAAKTALRKGFAISHLQFPCALCSGEQGGLGSLLGEIDDSVIIVTHSMFSGQVYNFFNRHFRTDSNALAKALTEFGYLGSLNTSLQMACFDVCLAENPEGVVLASMFSSRHLFSNINNLYTVGSRNVVGLTTHLRRLDTIENASSHIVKNANTR